MAGAARAVCVLVGAVGGQGHGVEFFRVSGAESGERESASGRETGMVALLLWFAFDCVLTASVAAVLVFYDYGAGFAVVAILSGEGMVASLRMSVIMANVLPTGSSTARLVAQYYRQLPPASVQHCAHDHRSLQCHLDHNHG